MKKSNIANTCAKTLTGVLTNYLKLDANSTSCIIVYQPEVPKQLDKFKVKK